MLIVLSHADILLLKLEKALKFKRIQYSVNVDFSLVILVYPCDTNFSYIFWLVKLYAYTSYWYEILFIWKLLSWWLRICLQCQRLRFYPWVGKIPWKREWQPTQYSCQENSMDRRAWWDIVRGVPKSQTWLRDEHFHFLYQLLVWIKKKNPYQSGIEAIAHSFWNSTVNQRLLCVVNLHLIPLFFS